MRKTLHLVSTILFNVFIFIFGFAMLFTALCKDSYVENMLSTYLFGEGRTETITTGKEPIRFKTWYSCVEDVLNGNDAVAAAAQAEGTVLLKNENAALPLDPENDKVSLFGVTAYNPMYSLDGAGEVKVNKERQQFFKEEMENVGLAVNSELAEWYNSNKSYWRNDYINIYDNTSNTNGANATLNGAPWSALPASKTAAGYNTAVFVTGRMTNEAIDLRASDVSGKGAKDNDYLKFTDNELSVLQGLKDAKAAGTFKKIIVLFNQANPVQEDLPEVLKNYGVDAALWIGFTGSAGIKAVADILVGKTNPSAGLSTAWYANQNANPSTKYFAKDSNVILQEGIYVGYRYAETRYEDVVLGTDRVGAYDYGANISYPFGYGQSYTNFSYEVTELVEDPDSEREKGDDYILKVRVTNNGSVAGKENVQVYLQQPYTALDIQHKVEKPSVQLVGFGKTSKLEAGASEVVEIKIDANKYFAAYDITANKYILDEGTYYIAAARNAHEAVNSILLKKDADGAAAVDKTKMDSEYGAGNAALVRTVSVDKARSDAYKYHTLGGAEVTNLFDHADPNKASGDAGYVTFMSRNNWTGTADVERKDITLKGNMNLGRTFHGGNNFTLDNIKTYYKEAYESYPDEYPNYGLHRDENGIAEIPLAKMIGVEYDEKRGATQEDADKWEYFLDQLTWEETCTLVSNGLRRTINIDSIGKPRTNDVNASNAISWMFDMSIRGGAGTSDVGFANRFDATNREHNPTGYPCEGIIAASFNTEVAYAVGQAIGEDGLWTGAVGLYGFGLGLHRNPYHGRAGEYYSDDPVLTGIMGGYETLGAQSKGMYVYNKHFVLNDQETNRTSYNTWLTEQTFREIYLRPFELAIEIGDAMNVMTSFNNIGSYWSGNDYNLMTKCLRGEFGMRGFAVTDWWQSGGMNLRYGILAGNDLPDGNGAEGQVKNYGPDNGEFGFFAQAMRQSARRILYTVANSAAMNFIGDDTRIISYDPEWFAVRDALITTVIVLFAVSAAFFAATTAWTVYEKVKSKNEEK